MEFFKVIKNFDQWISFMLATCSENVIFKNLYLVLTAGCLKISNLVYFVYSQKEHKKQIYQRCIQKPVEQLRPNFSRKEIKTRFAAIANHKLILNLSYKSKSYLNPFYHNLEAFCAYLSFVSLFPYFFLSIFLSFQVILFYTIENETKPKTKVKY